MVTSAVALTAAPALLAGSEATAIFPEGPIVFPIRTRKGITNFMIDPIAMQQEYEWMTNHPLNQSNRMFKHLASSHEA
jgi:hypothetical protein